MQIGPLSLEWRSKGIPLAPLSSSGNGWFPWGIIRESFTGAWQNNVELRADQVMTNPTLFAVQTLIASDVAKLALRLVEQDDDGIWTETSSPAFSPVLAEPNHYQIITKFIEQWILSKLGQGNTYVLLQRDQRRVVTAMYVLEPSRVTPLVTPRGDVYYELKKDDLSVLGEDTVVVPASEIIHDRMCCLFHPLIGVTPIYACGAAAHQGLTIARNSTKFFANGSQPGAVLLVPGKINDDTAIRLKNHFDTNYIGDNYGKLAVLSDNMKLEYPQRQSAVDSQLIEQMNWSDERICSAHHVAPYMVGVGPPPPYANVEPLLQAYYAQCLQSLLINLENCLDKGLGLKKKIDGKQYGVEFDISDLSWMDTATKMEAANKGIRSGMSVDEVRKRYHGLTRVKGGDVVYMQEQNHSLEALAAIDEAKIEAAKNPQPLALPPAPDGENDDAEEGEFEVAGLAGLLVKGLSDAA